MQALTFQGIENVRCEAVADPSIEAPDDVLVRIRLAAICGSDLHVYHGRETGLDLGTVMGHEFIGDIVEAGSEVHGWRPGQTVVVPFTTSCGACLACRRGLTSRCQRGQLFGWVENGIGLQGAQAEYVRVPLAESTLVAVPPGLPLEEVLLTGDVLATGLFCAEAAAVGSGTQVAVVGCGPVGLMAIAAARSLGAETVLAFDQFPSRLELAESFGAKPVDLERIDPIAAARRLTGGDGVDAVLEAVGSPAASRLAFAIVRAGGTISAVGVHNEDNFAFSPSEAYDKNLTYRIGRCPVRAYSERALEIVRSRRFDLASIISHRLPLRDGAYGYAIFAERRDGCTKVTLTP
jgi:threonine dehydrogenase-like Zn-dependent dehydrogenase